MIYSVVALESLEPLDGDELGCGGKCWTNQRDERDEEKGYFSNSIRFGVNANYTMVKYIDAD